MESSDLGVAPNIVEVRIAIIIVMLARTGQVKSLSAFPQGINVNGLVV